MYSLLSSKVGISQLIKSGELYREYLCLLQLMESPISQLECRNCFCETLTDRNISRDAMLVWGLGITSPIVIHQFGRVALGLLNRGVEANLRPPSPAVGAWV